MDQFSLLKLLPFNFFHCILNSFLDIASLYVTFKTDEFLKIIFISSGMLIPLLMVILYLSPTNFIFQKGMGIGFFIAILSLVCMFVTLNQLACLIVIIPLPHQDISVLIVELVLSALSLMFIYIALFEFICMCSEPTLHERTTKWCVQRSFSVTCSCFNHFWNLSFPSCQLVYYATNIIIGFVSFAVYVWIQV